VLQTALCDLLGIEHPVILAPMGSATSAEFAASAANAGALGSIGTLSRTTEDILRDLRTIRSLTNGAFAVNHVPHMLNESTFAETLALQPPVISFSLSDPGELVDMAHGAGAKVIVQVTTVAQAIDAAAAGADAVIAQGGEAGGFGGSISTMVLVPQVVDAVAPVPVIAAGGIFDGRGLAAALMLGATGVNMGTRFLASTEAPIDEGWQRRLLDAKSEDTVKADVLNVLDPDIGPHGFQTVLRSIRTPFLDEWNTKLDEARTERDRLLEDVTGLWETGRGSEFLATAGQSAGAIRDVRPVAEIIASVVAEAESVLRGAIARMD
jgi:enoyl-[acyl-carrier protein] reductase II